MRSHRRLATALCAAATTVISCGTLIAQGHARVIAGRVIDSASGAGLSGARITAIGRPAGVVTGDGGSFAMPSPSGARAHLLIDREGYESRALSIDIEDDTTRAVVALVASASVPRTRAADAPASTSAPSKIGEFDRRAERGIGGVFITEAEIDRRKPRTTAELLRGVAAVQVLDTMGTQLIVSTRGQMYSGGKGRGQRMSRCILPVGVDGQVQQLGYSVNLVVPENIHGIEIFGGPSSIPTEYAGVRADADCGLVMIWTREH